MLGKRLSFVSIDRLIDQNDRQCFRNHFNLYIGWGQKNDSFHPPIPVRMEKEYSIDLIEVNDPTVEQEKKFEQRRAADSTLGDLTSSGEIESEGEAEEEIE